jgi:hypothetical protein
MVAHLAQVVAASQTIVMCPDCIAGLHVSPEVFGYVARCEECDEEFVVHPPGTELDPSVVAAQPPVARERRPGNDPWFDGAPGREPYRFGNPSVFLALQVAIIMITPVFLMA